MKARRAAGLVRVAAAFSCLVVAAAIACGKSEPMTAPSTAATSTSDPSTAALAPPTPLEPLPASVQPARPTFLFRDASHPAGVTLLTYRVEIAADPAFASMLQQIDVPEAATSTRLNLATSLPAATIFWRVRSVDPSGQVSDPSPVQSFTIGAPFLDPPTLVSPQAGVTVNQRPALVIQPGAHWGRPSDVTYAFQVSANPTFDTPTANVSVVGLNDSTVSITLTTDLAPGTYFWRVRSVIPPTTDRSTGQTVSLTSAFTDAQAFTVGESILAPVFRAPAPNAFVHSGTLLVVDNATRTGGGGASSYRFDLSTTFTFTADSLVSSATVVEGGAGQTTFPVPSLGAGSFFWRAVAIDPSTGAVSPPSSVVEFTIVAPATRVLTIEVDDPGAGSCTGSPAAVVTHTLSGTTTDAADAAHLQVSTNGTMGIDLVMASHAASGTIAGAATENAQSVRLSSSATAATPVALNGRVDNGGVISGTLDGSLRLTNVFGDFDQHQVCAAAWRVRPGS